MMQTLEPDHMQPNPPLVGNKRRDVTIDLIERDEARAEAMKVVRRALYKYGDMELLAKEVGRSPRCLYAIRGGYTRWPTWETLFALMQPLGLSMLIVETVRRNH